MSGREAATDHRPKSSNLVDNNFGPIREVLSPCKIAVLLFIEKYNRIGLKYGEGLISGGCADRIATAAERKSTARLLFELIQGGDLQFSNLLKLVENKCFDRQHVEAWKRAMKHVVEEGVEGLQCLFDTVHKAVLQDGLDSLPCLWTSIVGLYLRQMNLLYKRLSIVEVVTLHSLFVQYCTTLPKMDCNNSTESKSAFSLPTALDISMASPPSSPSLPSNSQFVDNNQDISDLKAATRSLGDVRDISLSNAPHVLRRDLLLQESECAWSIQQAEQLIGEQTRLLEFNESSALPARELHTILQRILTVHPQLSSAHYLSCLNFLRVNEAKGAMESLAAAYDCQQVTRATPRSLRYAALNMAALYSHFGSRSVALRCVSEVIAHSQEASDNTCLQHALAWLYVLAPTHKREALVQSAVQRSASLQLPYLSWLSLVNQAALPSLKPPAQRLQMLVSRVDGCVGVCGGGVGCVGGVWAVEAGVWSQWLGNSSSMSVVCSQLVLHAPPVLPASPSVPYASSQTAAALCNIAASLADAGEYSACEALLSRAQALFSSGSAHSRHVRLTRAHVSCSRFALLGSYAQALTALAPVAAHETAYFKIRSCEVAVAQGESECALQLVTELLSSQEVAEKPQLLVQVYLLYSSALCIAGNCSGALDTLVNAVSLALENHLALLHSLATLQLIAVQLQLGLLSSSSPSKSYERLNNPSIHAYNFYNVPQGVDADSIDRALSIVMASGSLYDQARSLLLLAKLRILACGGRAEKLCRVGADLERVKNMFVKVEAQHRVRDTLYLSSRVWHAAGQLEARNKCALEFRTLEQALPCKNILPPTPIF
ncbi:anaphase-promoting complex subunit 5 [Hyalella azteca]|uniref:Anaphase-promoting complex subunit 5 n=1 Tax=Hyalella azteca TaxID=294128 RepID=A0A979FQJ4_HYAAZ|nr:anaphase-promoting complex subunit 5 [Hyalella azteca]